MRTPRERLYGPPYADIPPNDPRPWRMSVTVTRDGGQVRMSDVEFVP